MSNPPPGALAAPAPAASLDAAKAANILSLRPAKNEPAVHITPLSLPASEAPSAAAATNPATSPTQTRSDPASDHDDATNPGSLNSQNLAWDQAVLRIEYLVSTMAYSPVLSPADNTSSMHHPSPLNPLSPLAGAGGANGSGFHITPVSPAATPTDYVKNDDGTTSQARDADDDADAPATKGWPSVSREKVRRKVLQIDTWRAEVATHGTAAFCGCSSPAPTVIKRSSVSENAATSPISPLEGSAPTSPNKLLSSSSTADGAPSPMTIPPPLITCGFCGRPIAPAVLLKSPTAAAGMKKALVNGFRGLLRRRSGSRRDRSKELEREITDEQEKGKNKGLQNEDGDPAEADKPGAGFVRTAMYRIDMPSAQAKCKSHSQSESKSKAQQARRSPDRGAGQESNDGDEEEVDLDSLSHSTNPRGLLETNDRLKRAEKLLARNRGGGAKVSGGGAEELKSAPAGDGGGKGSSGFGLGWMKGNGGDRNRKGFGKLL